MLRHKAIALVAVLLGSAALVGTGFSVFYFGSGQTESIQGNVSVAAQANAGTLTVTPVKQVNGSEIEIDPACLAVYSNQAEFNFSAFKVSYQPDSSWALGANVNISVSVSLTVADGLNSYFDFSALGWSKSESENIYSRPDPLEISASVSDSAISVGSISVPLVIQFTPGSEPVDTNELNTLINDISNQNLVFTFTADVTPSNE